jgi:serine/threonine protein kinase
METLRICAKCKRPLPVDAPEGLCPTCLAAEALGTQAAEASQSAPLPSTLGKDPQPPSIKEIAASFPHLEILELLGQGGMGVVYKARQIKLDRLVALKILPRETAATPGFAERFEREARLLARLNHPNIVGVYDFGETNGLYYLLMEYVPGLNLRQVQSGERLSSTQALTIVPEICDALQYAHEQGVVHRDIKPANILINDQGQVKIADFGLAKLLGKPADDLTLTGAHHVMGTPHYMAPEQIEHPQAVDHRADIYSLGVVFYEMLTGELPMGRFEPPSARMRGMQVDVRLDEVVLRALDKQPERRYQQASEVRTDVEKISASRATSRLQEADRPDSPKAPIESRDAVRSRVQAVSVALLGAGILRVVTAMIPGL